MKGSVRVRNGTLYAVISYKDNLGQYKQKWISTGLKERGNKKQAQKILETELEKFTLHPIEENPQPAQKNDIIFIDYIYDYIKSKEKELSPNVYQSYMECWKIMKKHFGNKLKLKDITYHHIEDYYDYLKNTRKNKNITIKHHAVILSPALRLAYRDDLIAKNPYEFMPKIKKEKSKMEYYNKEELEKLFEVTDKSPLKLIVRVAAYYGFRRSELLDNEDPIGQVTILFSPNCSAVKNRPELCNGTDTANMNAFRIEKKYENQGHISKLVKMAEEFARSKGIKFLTIGSEAKESRNLAIYLHFGYTEFVTSMIEDNDLILYYKKTL